MVNGDTVVALSTPYGYGGIGVVRVTGPGSLKVFGGLSCMSKRKLHAIKPRFAYKKIIYDENKVPFDDVLITLYKGPKSYTGEDVLEISCHGSPYILKYVVDLCIKYGATPAGPGEFTKRAFINGKIDLVQAESVANMVSASSHRGVNISLNVLRGSLSKEINVMRDKIIEVLNYSEHLLDVSEDDLTDSNTNHIIDKTTEIQKKVKNLMNNYNTCRIMTSGAIVVLCGPSNSGKSTLFNSLVGLDRAIVDRDPGTTRDLLESIIIIDGIPITLVDTAGLRETDDSVETEGIRRALDYVRGADLICLITDITLGIKTAKSIDNTLLKESDVINIYNKIDLITTDEINKYRDKYTQGLFTSAITGLGLKELKKQIVNTLNLEKNSNENYGITTPRQYNAIVKSDTAIDCVLKIANETPIQLELISYELQSALRGTEDLLGIKTADEILNNMFNSFCVGK